MRKWNRQSFALRPAVLVFTLATVLAAASTSFIFRTVKAQDAMPVEPGVARNENLEITVRAGFGRLEVNHWNGSWVPFRITLSNQGPPITGRLVVHCESNPNPTPQVREYVKEIQLPTGSHQLHEIAAFLNSGENPIVRLYSGDRVAIETVIAVQRSFGYSDQLEIAVVDTDATALNNIASAPIARQPQREPLKGGISNAQTQPGSNPKVAAAPPVNQPAVNQPAVNQPQGGPPPQPGPNQSGPNQQGPNQQGNRSRRGGPQSFTAHPSVIQPEDLPRDFISYDLVDSIVINDAPLNQLTEEQARAIKHWVAAGGLLVVTGGADFAGMRVTALDELLPVEAQSAASTSSFPLTELTQVYGAFESGEQLVGMTARVKNGARAIVGSDDRPIVAEKNYGSGIVRFIAINPKLNPYRGWSAAKDLWSDLLLPAAETKPRHSNWITFGSRGQSRSSRWGVQGYLYRLAEIGPPSPNYVIFFLLFYVLAVGPLNYAVLKWKRKTDLAWLTIPAVVILFTLVSVTVAQMSRGSRSLIADVSMVDLHQSDGIANINSGLLIMPASKGTQQVAFGGRDTYANDAYNGNQSSSASASGSIESERGQKDYTLRVPMTTWTAGLFQIRSVREDQSPIVSASGSGQNLTIKNLGDAQITRAVYLSAAGISNLFDLAANGQQPITLSTPAVSSFNSWYLTELGSDNDESDVFQDLAELLDREVGGDRALTQGFFETQMMTDALKRLEHPMLIGFIETSPTEMEFKGSFKRRSKAFYVIHL
ncbi:MAG: hypothetical protein WBV94_20355 [Blastocatellia bacterium]